MSEKTFFWAMLLTLGLCLASVVLEHFNGNEFLYLIMLGPPMLFWGSVFSLLGNQINVIPEWIQTVLFALLVIVYYGLFFMPILIARCSFVAAFVWGIFFLSLHLVFITIASALTEM